MEDVESIDPILNPVLNKEVHKTGGRVLVTLGDREIDFSPAFSIFLSTRDPACQFAPDLCSRVTFVNFTVTPSSLQTQCLSQVLKSERPDVYQKRLDLFRLQGQFRVELRNVCYSLTYRCLLVCLSAISACLRCADGGVSVMGSWRTPYCKN